MYCYTKEYLYSVAAALPESTFDRHFLTLSKVLLHHSFSIFSKCKPEKKISYTVITLINTHIYIDLV